MTSPVQQLCLSTLSQVCLLLLLLPPPPPLLLLLVLLLLYPSQHAASHSTPQAPLLAW